MTWWVLTDLSWDAFANSASVACTTNLQDYLLMHWQLYPPRRTPRYRRIRGQRVLCGYFYTWDTPHITEQNEIGQTFDHTFTLPDLPDGYTVYAYVLAPGNPWGYECQGPLFWFSAGPGPPPPIPKPATQYIPLINNLLRCGTRLTYWANDAWYVLIPTTTALTVWKDTCSGYVRQDAAHEPTPTRTKFTDADGRISLDQATLHTLVYDQGAFLGPHTVTYTPFDTTTDTWGAHFPIASPSCRGLTYNSVAITLDPDGYVHAFYIDAYTGIHDAVHQQQTATGWSAPLVAIATPAKIYMHLSASYSTLTERIYITANRNDYLYQINSRTYPPGNWGFPSGPGAYANIPHNSIMAQDADVHAALMDLDILLDHRWGNVLPWVEHDINGSPFSRANIISGPGSNPHLAVLYINHLNDVAQIHQPPGGPWSGPTTIETTNTGLLVANLNRPDVISAIWQHAADMLAVKSWYAPWHT